VAILEYFAKTSVCIQVNGREYELTAGRGALKILLAEESPACDISTVRIESTSKSPSPTFVIVGARIEVT
jgi:tRNA1(Val) A37 N6-methylase TrmN6